MDEKENKELEVEVKLDEHNGATPAYTQKQLKEIMIHRVVLFIAFFSVLAFSAMKALIGFYPIIGYAVCAILAGLLSYFMSFTMYAWKEKSGWSVYLVVVLVIVLMLARYGM